MIKDDKAIHDFMQIQEHSILLRYIEKQRVEALGWMLAECCASLDAGVDPRYADQGEILNRALKELSQ